MPGIRLLVIADSKMLPALANGLREGLRFDVLTVPLSDPAGAQAAAEKADAVAIFYGAPGAPLPVALQSLSPKVRDRGGRVVAVLQREQAAHRDECFKAGASDLLFMPMPKDQFVSRLQSAVELTWAGEPGAPVPVAVATRTVASRLDNAALSPAGVEAPGGMAVKAGDTVRLTWGRFQTWGLVVRGAPSTQIRFAGLAPDEEAQIRDWLKSGAPLQPPSVPPPASSSPPPPPSMLPPASSTAPAAPVPLPGGTGPASEPPPPADSAARAAPAAGPPPGFADRKPIRPQARSPVRIPPPVMNAAGSAQAKAAAAEAEPAVAAVTPASTPALAVGPNGTLAADVPPAGDGASAANGASPANGERVADGPSAATLLSAANGAAAAATPLAGPSGEPTAAPAGSLFEPGAAAAAVSLPAPPAGPAWPVPVATAACKAAALQFLKDKTVPADTPPAAAASAKKVTGMLSSGERAALEKAGSESPFAEALAARIALDAATADGVRLYSASPAAAVDAAAVSALIRIADDATAALQKEANAAVSKGEVESLQMVTAASAALSRDVLTFRETADRLRGLGAAPRLGAGALDPDLVLPGQAPRAAAAKPAAPVAARPELRDFRGLEERRGRGKGIVAALVMAAAVAAAVNGFYFGLPHRSEAPVAEAGDGVTHIDVAGEAAMVTVSADWVAHAEVRANQLAGVLRARDVKRAILVLPSGATTGVLDVTTGKLIGVPKPAPPK